MIIQLFYFLILSVNAETRIAIVDTGLSIVQEQYTCKNGIHSLLPNPYDEHGHGTEITDIVSKSLKKNMCILSIKYSNGDPTHHDSLYKAIAIAVKLNPKIINISSSGYGENKKECDLIKANKHIIFVIAAGNSGQREKLYPAGCDSPNIRVVGATENNARASYSTYGIHVKYYLPGNYKKHKGTSYSAAYYTSKIMKELK